MTVRRLLIVLPAALFLLLAGAMAAVADDVTFADVGDTGQKDAVAALVHEGIVQGCDEDRFCSRQYLTRGHVATIIAGALDLPPVADVQASAFSDTDGSVHRASIDAIEAAGLTAGCGEGRFCPNDPIPRGQLARMLEQAFDVPPAPDGTTYFADTDGPEATAAAAIAEAGITTGCDLIDFCPNDNLQRIHAAVFFARALDLVERAELSPFDERKAEYEERLAQEQAEAAAKAEAKAKAEAEAKAAALAPSQKAVEVALAQLGKPYRWGGSGPHSFDCSGLTSFAWAAAGVTLPRTSRMQYSATTRISRSELRPGDLVFYHSPISHVAMYIGDGKVVEAPNSGNNVRIRNDGLTRRGVVGFGRVTG